MPTIDLPQGTVHYSQAGPADSDQPPAVLIHGLLVDGRLWQRVAGKLAESGIRSIAPDLPLGAHARALQPDADLSPRAVAALINDFLAALDLSDVTLVGNDTGGALCQFLIDADASRIGRLLLTNCDAFDKFPPPPFNMLVAAGRSERRLKPLFASMRSTALRHSVLGYGGLVSGPLDAELTRSWIDAGRQDAGVRHDTAKFLRGIEPAQLLDVSTRLGKFGKPTRIVWGTADKFFKVSMARRLSEEFGTATLVELSGVRTFVPFDAPDRLAAEIAALR
jgi:pimeloyl-ACP methyl ester carboxylesterase